MINPYLIALLAALWGTGVVLVCTGLGAVTCWMLDWIEEVEA
jgi:hypothetical protein